MKTNKEKTIGIKEIKTKIDAYKKLFFFNKLLKGSIFFTITLISSFLGFTLIEHFFLLNSEGRASLFFIFLAISIISGIYHLLIPLLYFLNINKKLSDETAAQQIGEEFPEIKDKLLNLIQLSKDKNILAQAAVVQKSIEFERHEFSEAVKIKKNKKYFPYIIIPCLIIIISILFWPNVIYKSTERILNFEQEFKPEIPFKIEIINEKLEAFHNEDFRLKVAVNGKNIPSNIYLLENGRKIKMIKAKEAELYEYEFKRIQKNHSFIIQAANYIVGPYKIDLLHKPVINKLTLKVKYPKYTKRKLKKFENSGNIQVPKGSQVIWNIEANHTDSIYVNFPQLEKKITPLKITDHKYGFSLKAYKSSGYDISLINKHSKKPKLIHYELEVEEDKFPTISLEQFKDTTFFKNIILGGEIKDDYGISKLELHYKNSEEKDFKTKQLPIDLNKINQKYYFNWLLDSLKLEQDNKLLYYLEVFDNDGVNGIKSSKTQRFEFKMPDENEVKEKLDNNNAETESKLEESLEQTKDLKESLEEIENRLKTKKELDWQDKKILESIIEQRKEVEQEIKKLNEQFKKELKVRDQFQTQETKQDKEIAKKVQALQKLMEEVLDEKTKKLYEELQKMLQEQNSDYNKVQDKINQINDKEKNIQDELDRAMELFKQMKVEFKMKELVKEMKELSEKQEALSKEDIKDDNFDTIAQKQDEIKNKYEKTKENINKMQKLNQDLKSPNAIPDTKNEINKIDKEQNDFEKAYSNKKKKSAEKSQDNLSENMKALKQKLKQMSDNMEAEQISENLEDLRKIQSNLIQASFEQERILDEFKQIKNNDPQVIVLSQNQIVLKENTKVIQDSLVALSERVFQLSSMITRELNEMNNHIDDAVQNIKDRKFYKAKAHQQFTMTSMNNLALMLDNLITKMQNQQQQDGQGKPGKDKKPSSSLSELQKQLNKKIQDLKKSGKQGRQLSEEVAKLAAEQERIRKALEEFGENSQPSTGGKEKQAINDLLKKMEETELDLVNKRLSNETIKRQAQINSQLLKTEKALKEQELDKKRKAEKVKHDYENAVPKAFEEYIKMKKKEIERFKTIPVELNPYFKEEVNKYFNQKQH